MSNPIKLQDNDEPGDKYSAPIHNHGNVGGRKNANPVYNSVSTESVEQKLESISGMIDVMDFNAALVAISDLNRMKSKLDEMVKQRGLALSTIQKKFKPQLQAMTSGL